MNNSSDLNITLCGWLQNNDLKSYNHPLRVQRFLYLYGLFSLLDGDISEVEKFNAYQNGPICNYIFNEYMNNKEKFDELSNNAYCKEDVQLNINRAKKCAFFINAITENELISLICKMNIWKCHKVEILNKKYTKLNKSDFNDNDKEILNQLNNLFSSDLINNTYVLNIDNTYFLFSNQDKSKITPEVLDELYDISNNNEIDNPIFIKITPNGELIY